ncbi:uncharacterized protein LOC134258970 isoform X2 [Saccostrea cucullata]|uniref:uncharacterized protein LOC134258970 isoform X2 n=1 Tax=Saccostrea cuccullata TaxID=36930 RepID=UPI002ED28541
MRTFLPLQSKIINTYMKVVLNTSIPVFIFLLILREVNVHVTIPSCLTDVNRVPTCPRTKEQWLVSEEKKGCSRISLKCNNMAPLKYHCLINAWRNATFELCGPDTDIIEYNEGGERIQPNFENKCDNFSNSCPFKYKSSLGYLYPECFVLHPENDEGKEKNPRYTEIRYFQVQQREDQKSGFASAAPLFILFLFTLIITAPVCMYCKTKRDLRIVKKSDDRQTTEVVH